MDVLVPPLAVIPPNVLGMPLMPVQVLPLVERAVSAQEIKKHTGVPTLFFRGRKVGVRVGSLMLVLVLRFYHQLLIVNR